MPNAGGFLTYAAGVVLVVTGMLSVSALLGGRHRERSTDSPYESGIPATGSARLRLNAPFYLVAMLFVIFDLEVAFLFGWAIAFRRLGMDGFLGAMCFLVILGVALLYEWREGALDWSPDQQRAGASRPSLKKRVRQTGVREARPARRGARLA
jgi:NADH-quinone oxidoreductase subunit A